MKILHNKNNVTIVATGSLIALISYTTTVAHLVDGELTVSKYMLNASQTTAKHFNAFVRDYMGVEKPSKSWILKEIELGNIKVVDDLT